MIGGGLFGLDLAKYGEIVLWEVRIWIVWFKPNDGCGVWFNMSEDNELVVGVIVNREGKLQLLFDSFFFAYKTNGL